MGANVYLTLNIPTTLNTPGTVNTDLQNMAPTNRQIFVEGLAEGDTVQVWGQGQNNLLGTFSLNTDAEPFTDRSGEAYVVRTAGEGNGSGITVKIGGEEAAGSQSLAPTARAIGNAGDDIARFAIFVNKGDSPLTLTRANILATVGVTVDATANIQINIFRTRGGVVTQIDTYDTADDAITINSGGLDMQGIPYVLNNSDTLSMSVTHRGAGKAYNFTLQVSP